MVRRRILGLEERVEEKGVKGAEPECFFPSLRGKRLEDSRSLEPLLGKHSLASVAEGDEAVSPREALQNLRHRHHLSLEVDFPLEVQPVDPAREREPARARSPHAASFREHDEPFLDEPRRGFRKPLRFERPEWTRPRDGVESELCEKLMARPLEIEVARGERASLEDASPPVPGVKHRSLVVELELRAQRRVVRTGPKEPEPGRRADLYLPDRERGRQLDRRTHGKVEEPLDELVGVLLGGGNGAGHPENRRPEGVAGVLQARDAVFEADESGPQQDYHLRFRSLLVSALKRGREGRTLPGIRAGEPERQTIRGAVVPRERRR